MQKLWRLQRQPRSQHYNWQHYQSGHSKHVERTLCKVFCLRWACMLKTKQCSGLMLRGNLYLLSLSAERHLCLCSPQWGPSIPFSAQANIIEIELYYPIQSLCDWCLTVVWQCLPFSKEVLPSKHLVVTSGWWGTAGGCQAWLQDISLLSFHQTTGTACNIDFQFSRKSLWAQVKLKHPARK